MSDGVDEVRVEAPSVVPAENDENPSVEAYETDEGTVLYDAWNPLAWIESGVTVAIDEAA
jgi:hypothetical protein